MRKDEVLTRIGAERKLLKVIRKKNILVGAYIALKLSAATDHRGKGGRKEKKKIAGKKEGRND